MLEGGNTIVNNNTAIIHSIPFSGKLYRTSQRIHHKKQSDGIFIHNLTIDYANRVISGNHLTSRYYKQKNKYTLPSRISTKRTSPSNNQKKEMLNSLYHENLRKFYIKHHKQESNIQEVGNLQSPANNPFRKGIRLLKLRANQKIKSTKNNKSNSIEGPSPSPSISKSFNLLTKMVVGKKIRIFQEDQ